MKIRVHEMYDAPDESDLAEQVEYDVSKALDANISAFRDAVLKVCPKATVIAGDIQVKNPEYMSSRCGSSLTATVICPVSVMLPLDDDTMEEAIDDAVADLEPIEDKYGYLQGLEWMASWDDKATLAYVLDGLYKKES